MARPEDHVIVSEPKGTGWNGLDLRSTTVNVSATSARDAKNVHTTQASGSLTSRNGYKASIVNRTGAYGLLRYSYLDTSTGQNTVEELIVKDDLYKIYTDTITITYSDPATAARSTAAMGTRDRRGFILGPSGDETVDSLDRALLTSTFYIGGVVDPNASLVYATHLVSEENNLWTFRLFVDGEEVLTYVTSVGFDEDSIPTLLEFKAAVEAVDGFSVAIGANLDTALPAAVAIPSMVAVPFDETGELEITCEYDAILKTPAGADPNFNNTAGNRNSPYFENATSYNVNSVIYINTGYDAQKKYDGQKVYNSGLPEPASTFAAAVGSSGNVDDGEHTYTMFYRQRDKRGNVVEGVESAEEAIDTGGSAKQINLTLPTLEDDSGYNTDMAVVNGNQTNVNTITVDSGNTLQVGDNLTFFNRDGDVLLTDRTVTASSDTSITIDGDPVDVDDNDVISAGLTIQIVRTKVGDTTPFYVAEIPHNSSAATMSYTDNIADDDLFEDYPRPPVGFEHGLPPQGRYGVLFSGIPVITGVFTDGDAAYYADPTGPEHFPSANYFRIRSKEQDSNTGLYSSQEYLLIFKSRSTYLLAGDISRDDFIIQERTLQVGCASHASIVQLPDGSVAFMSLKGPQRLAGASPPDDIGYNILPLFLAINNSDHTLQLKRTIGISDIKLQHVYFFIPTESTDGTDVAANENSLVLAFDTQRGRSMRLTNTTSDRVDMYADGKEQIGSWFKWTNMNWAGGALLVGNTLRWIERRYSSFDGDLAFHVYKRLNAGTVYDFVDHTENIDWRYASGWESLGAPSVYKLPLRHKIYSDDALMLPMYEMSVQTNLDYAEKVDTEYTASLGTAAASAGYGFGAYGVDAYGAPIAQSVTTNLKRSRCQAFSYVFVHNKLYAAPLITAWETEVAVPFNTGIKK